MYVDSSHTVGHVIDAVQVFSSVLVVQILRSAANDFQRALLIKQFARFPRKHIHKQTYFSCMIHGVGVRMDTCSAVGTLRIEFVEIKEGKKIIYFSKLNR